MMLPLLKRIFKLLLELFTETEANSLNILTGVKFLLFESGSYSSQSHWDPSVDEQVGWPGCPSRVQLRSCEAAILVAPFTFFVLFIIYFINLVTQMFTQFKFQRTQ